MIQNSNLIRNENDNGETLADKTKQYWELSSAFNGRIDIPIPYMRAIRITGGLLDTLDPYRPLAKVLRNIEHEIIHQDFPEPSETCAPIAHLSERRSQTSQ